MKAVSFLRVTLASLLGLLLPQIIWAATEAHEESHEVPSMALIYWAINFLILSGLLFYFLRKPAKEFFSSRATLIRNHIEEAKQRKEEAAQKYAEYEARLKSIEQEMQSLITALQHDGELERRRLIETAEHQATTLKTTSQRILQQEVRKAKEELKREVVELASELAGELIRKNLTTEDQNRLLGQYLQKMENLG